MSPVTAALLGCLFAVGCDTKSKETPNLPEVGKPPPPPAGMKNKNYGGDTTTNTSRSNSP
jgi:hypothetical protein